MDFDDSAEEAGYRDHVRAFLDAHAPRRGERTLKDSYYSRPPSEEDEVEHVRLCKEWQRVLFDNGWAGITWPVEFGGRGLTAKHQAIFNQEQSRYEVHTGIFSIGIGMTGPMLIAHGTDAQKERFLPKMLTGEEVWCQLFSEPEAGSDLGALRTSAVRDGDEYVVNGQKVWNSGAQYSNWGILLTRTDVEAPKHRGITYMLLDMRTPGVEVRPLRQITGASHFNEVFFSDVRIPSQYVIGQPNAGWGPMMTTLANERTLIGGGQSQFAFGDVVDLARHHGRAADPSIRQDLARLYSMIETQRYLGLRVATAASKGVLPGPESSVMKLGNSRRLGFMGDLVMEISGASGMLANSDAYLGGFWQQQFLSQWMSKFGGGTDQIQRNTIGDKVLQLPPEPRVDKNIPFNQIPR